MCPYCGVADYLQQVYEALLLVNDIDIETLRACANAETESEADPAGNKILTLLDYPSPRCPLAVFLVLLFMHQSA